MYKGVEGIFMPVLIHRSETMVRRERERSMIRSARVREFSGIKKGGEG